VKKVLSAALMLLFAGSVNAEVIQVEYSRFYSHVKKLDGEDTQALQFAFGFQRVGEGRLCEINNAKIVTDKQTLPLEVSEEYRFTVPSEKVLKMAEAFVEIDLAEAANLCDMSVQLETKTAYLKMRYSKEELTYLLEQYRSFFNEMGSFLSFMMPTVDGLNIQFADENISMPVKDAPNINMGTQMLSAEWIESSKGLVLPEKPFRITAKATK